jgi:hypothetical protein
MTGGSGSARTASFLLQFACFCRNFTSLRENELSAPVSGKASSMAAGDD